MNDYARYFEGLPKQRRTLATLPQLGTSPQRPFPPVMRSGYQHAAGSGSRVPVDPGFGWTPPGLNDGGYPGYTGINSAKPTGEGWQYVPGSGWGRPQRQMASGTGSGPGGRLGYAEWLSRFGNGAGSDTTSLWQNYQDYIRDFQGQNTPGGYGQRPMAYSMING